jgi:hypothetical protein
MGEPAVSAVVPVWLDGPLEGKTISVPASLVEQGNMAHADEGSSVVYTFTRVALFGHIVVVASVSHGIPDQESLYQALTNERARQAAE